MTESHLNHSRFPEAVMTFFRDMKFAVRSLARTKGLTLTVVITLALGIGANGAIFSLVRGVLLRPIGDTVVLMPPLTITSPEVHRIVAALSDSIDEVCDAPESARWCSEQIGSDADCGARYGDEAQFREATRLEPRSDRRGEIGREGAASPDRNRAGRAERGELFDGVADVIVGDVAEDTADEHDIRGNGALICSRRRCVRVDDLDAR